MAVILENAPVAKDILFMRLKGAPEGKAGQFAMLRVPGALDPFLGRPISLFDSEDDRTSLLYQVKGRGTEAFARLRAGQEIDVPGPYGNGFPLAPGDAALIGGGIGIAPLYLLAKTLRKADPQRRIDVYLGFRDEAYLADAFAVYADAVTVDIGGFVTEKADFSRGATFYACGPSPMMRAAAREAEKKNARLYVSLEKHMACGVGACLGCTCRTTGGQKRVCRDGPVFDYREVIDEL